MSEGVVPDSDPLPPPLDPFRPEWRLLGPPISGSGSNDGESESAPDADSGSDGAPTRIRSAAGTGSETLGNSQLMLDSSPLLGPVTAATTPEPIGLDAATKASRDASSDQESRALDAEIAMAESHLPRRKRFNFETWVRYEKRAHERVYHRRYAVFHGANSDSEDDDYGEMDDGSTELGAPLPEPRQLEPEDLEVISSELSQRPELSPSAHGHTEASSRAEPSQRPRRRIIDSESEPEDDVSISDAESLSSTKSLLPIYEQRLTKPIPASRRLPAGDSDDVQHDSIPDSLSDIEPPVETQTEFSAQRARNTLKTASAPALVREVAPIDYMLSRRSAQHGRRLGHRYVPLAVTDLAQEAGTKATKALKVAARTAKRVTNTRRGNARTDNPLKKFFAGTEAREASKTLRQWRQGTLHLAPEHQRREKSHSSVHSGVDGSRSTTTSSTGFKAQTARKTQNPVVTNVRNQMKITPASRSLPSTIDKVGHEPAKKRRKAPSERRRAPEVSPDLFHTTILERQVARTPALPAHSTFRSEHPFVSTRSDATQSKAKSSYEYGKANRMAVSTSSPSVYFDPERFGKDTIIGSNTMDILESPAVWNGKLLADRSFGTPLISATEAVVTKDAEYVLATCEGNQGILDDALFNKMYDYFFEGSAFLCDESQIVEAGFRKHVYRQWLRLARSLLKLSLRTRFMGTEAPLLSQLVSLATVMVARRLSTLAEVNFEKASLLVAWTSFYQQSVISDQIDGQLRRMPRRCVGAELVHVGIHFRCFDYLPQVFSKHSQASAKWHMLLLLSACRHRGWFDWDLARSLVSVDASARSGSSLKPDDVRVATDYIMRLLLKWNWPPSAEIIIDLFNFYAKQQHYADPRGESIWLPDFLLRSRFDGSHRPDQDFSMFLELLGCTLGRLAGNVQVCRRIAGRVTPLSALSFPETKEVSLADLSSASHQYGILIVLLRMLPRASRPPISQFRDLVVLKDAHLAIRIKAVSTWSIVSRLATDSGSTSECQAWLRDDILRAEAPPPQLLLVTLRSAAEVSPIAPEAVPFQSLLDMGLRSAEKEIRSAAWTLLARMRPSDRQALLVSLKTSSSSFDHLDESDVAAFAKLVRAAPELVEAWPDADTRPALVANLLETHALAANHPVAKRYILSSALRGMWRPVDQQLLQAARMEARSEVGDRQVALRHLLGHSVSREVANLALGIARREWDAVKNDVAARLAYKVVVAQTRQLIFEQWPDLLESNTWFDDAEARGVELAQLNISKFVSGKKNAEGEFFFAYKLRRSLESDGGQSFTDEIVTALNLGDPDRAVKSFQFVVNELFTFYLRVAAQYIKTMEPALPTLVRSARIAMCRGHLLQYDPSPLLLECTRFLYTVLRKQLAYDGEILALVVSEVYILAYLWLQQVGSSRTDATHDGLINGLWTFGSRFGTAGFQWWEFESVGPTEDSTVFDTGAVANALKGINRTKVEAEAQNADRQLEHAWTAFDKLVRCYERYRPRGPDDDEALLWVEDPITQTHVQRPPDGLDNAT